jgi:GTPase Era involved in 16S rRNA processing
VTGEKKRAGDGLESFTQKVQAVRVMNHETYQNQIVLVDTPGFDDTHRSDMEILEMIGDWLKKT